MRKNKYQKGEDRSTIRDDIIVYLKTQRHNWKLLELRGDFLVQESDIKYMPKNCMFLYQQ